MHRSLPSRSLPAVTVAIGVMVFLAMAPRAEPGLGLGPGQAHGQEAAGATEDATSDTLLFARGSSLWRVDLPAAGAGKRAATEAAPVEVLRLSGGTISAISASRSGKLAVVETTDGTNWARLPAKDSQPPAAPSTATALGCDGHAYLSPDGRCVACRDRSGNVVLHQLAPKPRTFTLGKAAGPQLGFIDPQRLVVGDARGLWAVPLRQPAERTLLTSELPKGPLLVAPDGTHAIGAFSDETGADKPPALYVIRIEGKLVKRRLLPGAVPVGWSRDSKWIGAQMKNRACMVRAAGGEYKCWRGYQAVALAPDGSYLLMTKLADGKSESSPDPYDLYRGRREGVRPDPPSRVVSAVSGPAVWLAAE